MELQFEQMCRACMCSNSDEPANLQSVFDFVDDFQNKKIQIYELLNSTVQQLPKIEIMDALPQCVCTQCVEKLCAFYEFQNVCINSDVSLRKLIATSLFNKCAKAEYTDPLESEQNDAVEVENIIKHEMEERNIEEIRPLNESENFEGSIVDGNNDNATITDHNDETQTSTDKDQIKKEFATTKGHKEIGFLSCDHCETKFSYRKSLIKHMKHAHKIEMSVIKPATNLKKRSTILHREDKCSWFCDICEKSFLYKRNLQRHINSAHNKDMTVNSSRETKDSIETKAKKPENESSVTENKKDREAESKLELIFMSEEEQENDLKINDKSKITENDPDTSDALAADQGDFKRVYLCEICDVEFAYKKNLKRHYKRAHDYEMPKEMENDFNSASIAEEESRIKKHKVDNRVWHCEICKTQFSYKRNLRRHMKRTHNEESPIEIKTGLDMTVILTNEKKSFSESSEEEWDIPKIEIWTCERCQKKFSFKKNLKRHMINIHNEQLPIDITKTENQTTKSNSETPQFKCNECDSVFHKKVYLRKHKYRHRRPGGLKKDKRDCDICGLACKTLQNLREHFSNAHPEHLESNGEQLPEALKLYICQYCNKTFQQICTLKDHIRVHTKEQPFLCSHCGKAFNSNSNLRQHVLRHESEKRYECPYCPKKFPCLSDLASHKHVHSQVKPHVCDICGAAFGKPFQLKTHKMYHFGEKRYQCEYCAMRFVCGDHLRRHIRTHTGEKPYKCKYCPRSFSQSNDMIKHLRIHLGENVYQCELCPAAFRLASELRIHFALHKNDDEETKKKNKLAWHEAQEKLKLKLESDLPSHSKSRTNQVSVENGHFLFSMTL